MNKLALSTLGLVSALTCASAGAASANIEAFDIATVQPGGPRAGSSGKAFFNIEGSSNGSFASYGVARFDLTATKSAWDLEFGPGGWRIDNVTLGLTQSNAAFSGAGAVGVRHSNDDNVGIQPGSSPLRYANLASDFADLAPLLDYNFAPIATGSLESHVLYQRGAVNAAGAAQLLADLLSDTTLTLVLVDLDASVAATYAGATNFTLAGPSLALNVSAVPVPASLPLFGAALGVAMLRRRR
ncbi:MAG: PEP-CTERM sorting domain-containing protein [Gammaproteobacteria bacterium]